MSSVNIDVIPAVPCCCPRGLCTARAAILRALAGVSLPVDRAGHPAHSGNLRWLSTSRLRQPGPGRASPPGAVARCGCRRCGPVRPPAAGGLVLARGRPPPAATGSEWQPEVPPPGRHFPAPSSRCGGCCRRRVSVTGRPVVAAGAYPPLCQRDVATVARPRRGCWVHVPNQVPQLSLRAH